MTFNFFPHSLEELRIVRPDSGGPEREPGRGGSPDPSQSPLGSAAQRPDPATGSPPTVHPSLFTLTKAILM